MNSSMGSKFVFDKFDLSTKINLNFYVDIGANDGLWESTSYWLHNSNIKGINVECDDNNYNRLCINQPNSINIKSKITPDNIISILKENDCPKEFGFLGLDIDSYDYFVLDSLLQEYSPSIICCEINEKIPPPIRSTIKYISIDQAWDYSHAFGASIKMFEDFEKYGYKMFYLDYNNLYLSKIDNLPYEKCDIIFKNGYINMPDRRLRFPWNENVNHWLTIPTIDAYNDMNLFFNKYINSGLLQITIG